MSRRSLSHLSVKALLERLHALIARDRHLTVEILEILIEADWRRLWARAGYPSMYAWCMAEFGFSEDMAAKRICAARQARKHPEILDMVADGRLHLSGLIALAPKLKEAPERAAELLAASAHRSRRAIEALLAERFPQPDAPTQVTPSGGPSAAPPPAPGRVDETGPNGVAQSETARPGSDPPPDETGPAPAPGRVEEAGPNGLAQADTPESAPAPGRVAPAYSKVTPTAPQRYVVQFTTDEAMHPDLTRAQELLGRQADDDRVRAVLRRALRDLVKTLEKRKYAATERPRARRANGEKTRAQVRREVRERDGDRCTWVSGDGKRCQAREHLQFDHRTPLGKGGEWTSENVRLLCPAHNQLEADREYGEGFMHQTRERARQGRRALQAASTGAPLAASA